MNRATPAPPPHALEPAQIKRAFERAAAGYDAVAVLQAQVRERLLAGLDLVKVDPALIVDAGCGTGHAAAALARRYPRARVLALDLAEAMLAQARRRQRLRRRFTLACADLHALPLRAQSVDLVFCNLVLQWCDDLAGVLAELRRVLTPRGLLCFTTLGPDTLQELRAAWAAVDGGAHVHRFLDMHDVGDALVRAGLADPVLDVDRYTLTYAEALDLLHDLKALGAHNAMRGRPRGLTGRERFSALRAAYERFRSAGRIPATYEVVFAHAWGPLSAPPGPGGETRVPLERIGRRR